MTPGSVDVVRRWASDVIDGGSDVAAISAADVLGGVAPDDIVSLAAEWALEVGQLIRERAPGYAVLVSIGLDEDRPDGSLFTHRPPSLVDVVASPQLQLVNGYSNVRAEGVETYQRRVDDPAVPEGFVAFYSCSFYKGEGTERPRFASGYLLVAEAPEEPMEPNPRFVALERYLAEQLSTDECTYLAFDGGAGRINVGLPRDGHAYAEIELSDAGLDVDFGNVYYHRRIRNDAFLRREVLAVVRAVLAGGMTEATWWSGRYLRAGYVSSNETRFGRRLRRRYRRLQRLTLLFIREPKRHERRQLLAVLPIHTDDG
jgi:hypothetical protein